MKPSYLLFTKSAKKQLGILRGLNLNRDAVAILRDCDGIALSCSKIINLHCVL